jgi:predicted nucleotide-binding protein (sugar kinase/HSP70/actin superfamily)
MGLLDIAYTGVLRNLGVDMMPPPRPNTNTLNLGAKYSPEYACLPFKLNLGNMIEALERGANSILMPGGYGPCRFGYYGIIHEQILKGLGYRFSMGRTDNPDSLRDMVKTIMDIGGLKDKWDGYKVFYLILMRMAALDRVQKLYHYYKPREKKRGETDEAMREAVRLIDSSLTYISLLKAELKVKGIFRNVTIPQDPSDSKGLRPLKVGIVGEIFMVIEPFANMNIEKKLGEMGVEVIRGVWLSDWLNDRFRFKPLRRNQHKLSTKWAYPYLRYPSGGESIESVGKTIMFHRKGLDGVIHLMPFTCMPELVASTILERAKKDLNFPILSLVFDEQMSETNLITRLEAFIDMIQKKDSRDSRVQEK